jgi:hypothetical protein
MKLGAVLLGRGKQHKVSDVDRGKGPTLRDLVSGP